MKSLTHIVKENFKFKINRDSVIYTVSPKSYNELQKIIVDRYLDENNKKVLDLTDIDISNVPNLIDNTKGYDNSVFSDEICPLVETIDVTGWNVSHINNMNSLFSGLDKLKRIIGLDTWDTSNVEYMECVFSNCKSLITIPGIENWYMKNVISTNCMFHKCSNLTKLDLSNWEITKTTIDIGHMFSGCNKLQFIGDISNWDVSNLLIATALFRSCIKLKDVGDIKNKWKIPEKTLTAFMFKGSSIPLNSEDIQKI